MYLQRSGQMMALLAASTLILTACGSGNEETPAAPTGAPGAPGESSAPAESFTGTLNGGGSSAQEAAMEAWRGNFGQANAGVTVNYDPAGSSAGREQFLSGGLQFAGSDAALDDEEIAMGKTRCPGGDAINLPLYVSPVAIIYNLEGVDALNLSGPVAADIFNQKITMWNDPAIAALNEGTELPGTAITPVNRQDGSGTTENFTDYLAQTGGDKWPYPADGDWPVSGGESAQGTSGVVQAVTDGAGTIGYADFSRAGELGVARVQVGTDFVAPSPEGAAKAIETSERLPGRPAGDISLKINRTTTDPADYPISLTAYSIVCTAYADAAAGNLVKGFFSYVVSEDGQNAAAENAGSAPLTPALRDEILTTIKGIKAGA